MAEEETVEGEEHQEVSSLTESTTGEPHEVPDPSAQEDPSSPTWDETSCSSNEPKASIDPALSSHFNADPLTIVVPEMKSLSEEENEDSEEDYDNISIARYIADRSSRSTPKTPTHKRPTTRLQKKEALESVLKKNKEQNKKRRLVKGGKLVNQEVVPPALVVDVDDEMNEEPSSLIRMSSKKLIVPKSRKESSVRVMEVSNAEVGESGEKVDEESSEKVSEKSREKVFVRVSEKSAERGKTVRKSMKWKAGANEEPGSSKKAKVSVAKDEGRENLRNRKVLWDRTFALDILDMTGMRQLVDSCEFQ
ncbi:uncharacterized protein [Nicotiana tomentosiformis]|uniref:uncharacterized protein n=1 Tax=Nicotiana tomentosiformis TaxID=4098 RepID=UPI00388C7E25